MKALCMQKTLIMVFFGLILCALLAGCTSPTGAGIKTAGTTAPPTSPPLTTSVTPVIPTPMPVETLPEEQFVDLVLSKQRPDSSIHLLYNGGKGEVAVQNIMMKVTLSNGQVVQQLMNDGDRKPRRGDELVIEGTRGTDFVQVYLTSNGKTYKIIEEPLVLSYL
jgi:predicted small secreted protein